MRPSIAILLLGGVVSTGPAYAQPPLACAEVEAASGEVAPITRALADRGIPSPREGCVPVRVEVGSDGVWTVRLPHGVAAAREISGAELGAAWVDSLVRPSRLDDLLAPQVQPRAAPPAAPPAVPPEGIVLYGSFEAWRARDPVGVVDGGLSPRTVSDPLVGEEGLEPMWVIDRKKRDAEGDGRVFAFEVDGEVYVHDGSPKAHRGTPFGRLVAFGERGVFQREVCHWVQTVPPANNQPGAGFVRCEVDLRLLDLGTGEITPLTRARVGELVAIDPALAEAWDATRPKHVGAMRTFALRALEAGER